MMHAGQKTRYSFLTRKEQT